MSSIVTTLSIVVPCCFLVIPGVQTKYVEGRINDPVQVLTISLASLYSLLESGFVFNRDGLF